MQNTITINLYIILKLFSVKVAFPIMKYDCNENM